MIRQLLFALILLFSIISAAAQQRVIDSLKKGLAVAKEDTNKINLLLGLGWKYQWSDPDSGISYAREALQLAQKIDFTRGEMNAYMVLGEAFAGKGNYPKALDAKLKQLAIAEKLEDSTDIIGAFANIGAVYYYSKDYSKALYYFTKTKLNQAVYHATQELYSGFLGEAYFYLNQLDSALYYAQTSYDLNVRRTDYHWPGAFALLGAIYSKKGNDTLALDYYRKGIGFSTENIEFLNGYIGIAGVFKKMNQIDSSIYYAKQAIAFSQNGSFPSQIVESSEILADIYTTNHATDSAFKYMKIMMIAKDSLFSQAKQNLSFNEQLYHQELANERDRIQSKTKIYALLATLGAFLLIASLLYRNNRQKQKDNKILETTLDNLKSTQAQLIQSEKMASLGELTAGIAHEIQNPLNFVNNFSELNKELLTEMKVELDRGNIDDAKAIAKSAIENEEKIIHHGKRADSIVRGMLQHSRASSGQKEATDINELADECFRLAYHGLRAKDKSFNAKMETDLDQSIGKINIVPQEIGRVLLNLFTNAFYSVTEKYRRHPENYEPTVSVSTKKLKDKVEIKVKDNGLGIPQKVLDKIFQPFFTTKPTGQGTGLGLSLSYDIVTKGHGGQLKLDTKEGEFAEFIIILPTDK